MGRLRKWADEPYDEQQTRRAVKAAGARARRRAAGQGRKARRALTGTAARRAGRALAAVLLTALAVVALYASFSTAHTLQQVRAEEAASDAARARIAQIESRRANVKARQPGDGQARQAPATEADQARDQAAKGVLAVQNDPKADPFQAMRPYFPDADPNAYQGNVISPFSRWAGGTPCSWAASQDPADPGGPTTFVCAASDGSVRGYAQARWSGSGFSGFAAHMDGGRP